MCLPGYIKIPIHIRDAPGLTTSGRSVTAVLDVIRQPALDNLVTMTRGTRGAYRKEDRVALPPELQMELIDKAAARYGNCQELAKHLEIPKSSVHYYRIGRLTIPESLLERMLDIANDDDIRERVTNRKITKDRTWANEYAVSVYREMCRDKVRLPTRLELEANDELRRKAAAIVSYVLAEGSVWLQKKRWGECAVNITLGAHETDLYDHFRSLCIDVFGYDMGTAQLPGNGAIAIRGFIYSRFIAEWLIENGVLPGDKSSRDLHLPEWVMHSEDELTLVSALQPWCDGEGHVQRSATSRITGFSIAQSRHSDLDVGIIPIGIASAVGRAISIGKMKDLETFGVPLIDYCSTLFRSSVIDDVGYLFQRLGFDPHTRLSALRYKDDGSWSCIWVVRFGTSDTIRMMQMRLITQDRKRRWMADD